MRIIGFGAHPDDVEIFFLGFLLSCQTRGHEIGWAIATDGRLGFEEGFRHFSTAELAELRREEALAAARGIGVEPSFMGLPDGSLKADAAMIGYLSEQVAALSPDLAITHAPNDYHSDHRALSVALSAAIGTRIPILFADTLKGVAFDPMYYFDITRFFPRKQDAIRCHASQLPERFVHLAKTMNTFRALQCNLPSGSFAEGYRLGNSVRSDAFESMLPDGLLLRPSDVV
jgi:LmbE family N-acetylglucosaminyl deacetylase